MGYDVDVGQQHIYMTYNHAGRFKELGIYPRDFNGKKVKDILPCYRKARDELLKTADAYTIERIHDDNYMRSIGESLWSASDTAVCVAVLRVIETLEQCFDDDVWESD